VIERSEPTLRQSVAVAERRQHADAPHPLALFALAPQAATRPPPPMTMMKSRRFN
jgi:hypothetical protein